MTHTQITEWRPIQGYEGFYEISNDGRVRSSRRRGTDGRELSQQTRPGGHKTVALYRGNKHRRFHVHRLVLTHFGGERVPGKDLVLHADDNPENNHISNLRWGSRRENSLDASKNGRNVNANKTHCSRGHPFTGVNLRMYAGGRNCWACSIARSRGDMSLGGLILKDLNAGWRPATGRKQIEPGAFRAEESPESL